MPIDGVSSLQQFVNLASSVSDNSNIRATDKGLSATSLHTWASTNRASMAAFMSALKAEFGDTIADTASVQAQDPHQRRREASQGLDGEADR